MTKKKIVRILDCLVFHALDI